MFLSHVVCISSVNSANNIIHPKKLSKMQNLRKLEYNKDHTSTANTWLYTWPLWMLKKNHAMLVELWWARTLNFLWLNFSLFSSPFRVFTLLLVFFINMMRSEYWNRFFRGSSNQDFFPTKLKINAQFLEGLKYVLKKSTFHHSRIF